MKSCRVSWAVVLSMVLGVTSSTDALAQDPSAWMRSQAGRQGRAREWRAEFAKLDAQIPTLSPREQDWLKTEIEDTIDAADGKYTARAIAAMDSREYETSVAKAHISQILNSCDQLVLLISLGDERLETAQWTRLAALLIDHRFWQAVEGLARRDVIRGTINGVDQLHYENHVLWAQEILNGIVFRYLGTNTLE